MSKIEIPMPMSELCDRFTIVRLKRQRLSTEQADHKKLETQELYYSRGIDFKNETLLLMLGALESINGKIWNAEHELRKAADANLSLAEIGRVALKVRNLNMDRIALKNRISVLCHESQFEDVKMNYCSQQSETER